MDNTVNKGGSTLGAVLLIAGTAIGAGMLALPLVTGQAGFWPALAVSAVCWLFMLATGLLFLEVTLWMEDGANVLSMAQRFLGMPGKIVGGTAFLFLYYCLLVAYIAGGTPLVTGLIRDVSGIVLNHQVGCVLFSCIFGVILFLGTAAVDRVNWILMAGLVLSYILMMVIGVGEIKIELLERASWPLSLLALSTLFSAYGYHNVIPSLSTYLKRDSRRLRWAVVWGTVLPFVVYSLWQWLVIGTVPEEELKLANQQGIPVSRLLIAATSNPWIGRLTIFFSFFALVTSLLGVALSMVDFLGDGLKIKKRVGWRRLILCLVVFLPPALFAVEDPRLFFDALAYAGGFGEAILNGALPVLMVWVGRYYMGLKSDYRLPGGRFSLLVLLALTMFVIGLEIQHLLG